ncbi:MAG: hypothetical protein ACE5J4_00415 [Candidatus Aenigmatarchaeota archaeon]
MMTRTASYSLSLILLLIGIIIIIWNPFDVIIISIGMFLIAVAIINSAIMINFPKKRRKPVELKIVKTKPSTKKLKKAVRKKRK